MTDYPERDTSLTDEQIQALCDSATPGPWIVGWVTPGAYVARDALHGVKLAGFGARGLPDAAFVAAARDLVPSLLARAQKAEAENRRLVKALQRRSEPPSEERLARLLARAGQNKKHRAWRNVAWLIRQLGAVTAERDALAARLASAETRLATANQQLLTAEAKLRAVEALCDEQDAKCTKVGHVPLWTFKVRAALSADTTPEATE